MRTTMIAAALMAASLAAAPQAVLAHSLIASGTAVSVARSNLQVTPDRDWNKLSGRPGRDSETWTIDSDLLNDLSFYGGIQNGATLFREVDRRNRPLPTFSGTMLLNDIPSLLENSYRVTRGTTVFTIDQQEPAQFLGNAGVRFSYSFVANDNVRRKGEGNAAIIDGKLYMMTFEAPVLHYFDSGIASYRHLVSTARFATR